jgi:CO/xanthine dehydrogenase Mo-binding subunit
MKRGMGCAVGTWGGGGNNQCKVDVTISRDGSVVVAVGTQDLGTGTRTYTRAIVAEELGLTINDVKERIGNSKLGAANPSGGSTTAASLSPSVKDAAIKARMMMAERVAPLLGNAKPEEIVFSGRNAARCRGNRRPHRYRRQASLRTVSGAQTCRRAAYTVFALLKSKSMSKQVTSNRSRWSIYRMAACR